MDKKRLFIFLINLGIQIFSLFLFVFYILFSLLFGIGFFTISALLTGLKTNIIFIIPLVLYVSFPLTVIGSIIVSWIFFVKNINKKAVIISLLPLFQLILLFLSYGLIV